MEILKKMKKEIKKAKKFRTFGGKIGALINSATRGYLLFKQYIYSKIFINEKKIIITKVNDYNMWINPKDMGLSLDLYRYHTREPYSTKKLKELLKENDIVFDIGANIGYYVLLENTIIKNGKILGIEPVKENFELLEKNVKLNSCKNIKLLNAAVGDKTEIKEIYIYKKRNLSSLNKSDSNDPIKTEKIPVFTIKSLIKNFKIKPTVLRMDVEGYEYEIIKGMKDIITNLDNLLFFIELHPDCMDEKRTLEILNFFKDNNFKLINAYKEPPIWEKRDVIAKLGFGISNSLCKTPFGKNLYQNIDEIIQDKEFIQGAKGFCELFLEKGKR
ncbi:FkbM family methyltransferase [Candidatus Micrarchaeota archaeon]|nr:FkbM family methyltransferase [Candidatus Micrarchaeota archaeon]